MEQVQEEALQIDIYDIEITPEAQRGLLSVGKKNRKLIVDGIDGLAVDPRPSNSKLLYRAENLRRLTIGDYRVIYGITESAKRVTIEMVRPRSIVYTMLAALKLAVRSKGAKYSSR